jgi:hypothetical protein
MVAMFVNGSGRNEHSLQRTFHRCFLPSFDSFGQAVSDDSCFLLADFYTPVFKTGRIMVYHYPSVRPFYMLRSNLRTPWPIHFKFHRVIGIDGLMVCILYGEISIFIPELWDFIHQIVGDFSYS